MILDVLIPNLVPLYILIVLGYIAGRFLDVNLHSIARLNLYILLPIVTLGAMTRVQFQPEYFLLLVILFLLPALIALGACKFSQIFRKDGSANLIGAGGVNGNAIYFGLPLISALFGAEGVGVYLFLNMGPQINNVTLAYYLVARGRFSIRDSITRLIKFPVLYAMLIGLLLNYMDIEISGVSLKYWEYASESLVFLGMMMVGIGAGKIKKLSFDWSLIAAFFVVKFVIWAICIFTLIWLDMTFFHQLDNNIYQMLLLFSVMPLMGNLVAYAAEHDLHPEKAATAVILSSFATIFIIPAMYWLMVLIGIV